MSKQIKHFYEFGPFRLDATQRLLLRGGEVVPLTPKAFDLLLTLVESSGRVLTKDELMKLVWPDQFVEEANLSHNIYRLREALGDRQNGQKYIETLPRRGYRFVAKITETVDEGDDLLLEERTKVSPSLEQSEDAGHTSETESQTAEKREPSIAKVIESKRAAATVWVIGAACLLILSVGGYLLWRRSAARPVSANGSIHSLAVLPFRPLSAESRDESLELGMADALITKLSNIQQVIVRPTSSILKYENSDQDSLAAGREQNVDAVIEGKVQKAGDHLRLTVQLIRVSDGATVWAGTFDDNFTNIFAVQDSISSQVAAALVPQLTNEEQRRISKHYTDNIEAYQLYLKGRIYWYKFTPEDVEKSIDYFNRAIALDPSYALAYAGLSFAYSVQGAIGALPPAEVFPKSKKAAETAMKLDDTLAEAHVAVGGKYLLYEWNWSNAEREFLRAIELNPNQPDAHELLGYYWEVMGQLDKAEIELKNAQKFAPLMALSGIDIATLVYFEHRYDEAIDLYGKAHNLDPDTVPVPFLIGQAYERNGQYEQAISECQKALASSTDNPGILSALGYAYARAGRTSQAQAILNKFEEARKRRYVSPFLIALLCTGLDKKDEAFDWLNKAYDERDPQLIWVKLEPELEPLHSDPRFASLLQRIGIPQ
ncbi:MAG TPA: winged helix-turn-helix domain-containing protein [Pyrinomonadaceae bacterium]|nr:winged helix-turn-helix domain-containing protein [Pyrinomonadaceae bacterium]